jgi:hypothetical protein
MEAVDPDANESEALRLDDLTTENRVDEVSIYGSINITRDKRVRFSIADIQIRFSGDSNVSCLLII